MGILLITLALTLGLGWRAHVGRRRRRAAGVERDDENEMTDARARTSILVLASLKGLFALGATYGSVLGANAPH